MRNFRCAFLFLLCLTKLASQNRELDSLKSLLNKDIHDTTRLSIISTILENTHGTIDQEYSKKMIDLSQKNVTLLKPTSPLLKIYSNHLAEGYYYLGENLIFKTDFSNAINYFKKSISLCEKTGYTSLNASNRSEIAKALTMQEKYKEAIKVLYEALKLLQPLNANKDIGHTYLYIGRIYGRQKNNNDAIDFFKKALNEYKIADYKPGAVDALYKLSDGYSSKNNSVESANCILEAERIITTMKEKEKQHFQLLVNRVRVKLYKLKGNNELAIKCLNENVNLLKKAGVIFELAPTYNNLSDIYKNKKEYKKAILYAEKAKEINIHLHHNHGLYKEYENLYKLYKLVGDTKNALKMHELFILMSDSIQNKKDEKHVLEAELKYQFEKKELLSKIANEKKINELNILAERKNSQKNIVLSILAGILLLLIIGSCFLYYYFKQKSVIQNQKNNLLKQKLLLSQMNPHFIFNSLNAIQNYIFKKNVLQAGTYLSQFAEMIRMILEFSRKDYITLESELKFLENYLKLQQLRFDNKFEYHLIVDEEIDTETTLLPPMMAQPFIENAIEHGIFHKIDKGNINIIFNKNNNYVEYTIEDDGIGLNASKKLRSNLEQKHESLAMSITGERMQALYTNIKKEPIIELIDKKDLDLNTTGVKVKFSVQFKELLNYDKHINN